MWTGSERPPPPPPRCPGLVRRACAVFTLSPGPRLASNYFRLFSFARVTEKERESVFLPSISGASPMSCVELVPHHLGPVCAVSPVVGPGARLCDEGPTFHLHTHTQPRENKTGWAPKTSTYTLNNWVFIYVWNKQLPQMTKLIV